MTSLMAFATSSSPGTDGKSTTMNSLTPIEENPNYVPYESDVDTDHEVGEDESDGSDDSDDSDDSNSNSYDSDSTDYDEDEYDSSDDEEDDSKSILNAALAKTNKLPSKTMKFVRKNRTKLTIACALFAFRREIWNLILTTTTIPSEDGTRRARIKISPTSILKIAIFIDVMWKMQQGHGGDGGDAESVGGMFLPRPPGLAGLLTDIMKPSNAAFIPPTVQHYTFETINERYSKDRNAFRKAMGLEMIKSSESDRRSKGMNLMETKLNTTTIVMDMQGLDTGVSSMETLRDQVTFILNQHTALREEFIKSTVATDIPVNGTNATQSKTSKPLPQMEVIILLESPGGSATDYGLAANQIWRLRKEPDIKVTICVDKVAASGGYMIACMASTGCLYAAPFAVVGSIGVIGQTINIHNALQNWGVEPLVFRGGRDKAPVGLVGEVTKQGLRKVQDMVDKTHVAFKRHVILGRPHMAKSIDKIATGDVWLAIDGLEHGLVDGIMTSDEYIRKKISKGEKVLKLMKFQRPRFMFGPPHSRLQGSFHHTVRYMVDTVHELGTLLKKANAFLEDQGVSNLSRVASAQAVGINSAQTSMKN